MKSITLRLLLCLLLVVTAVSVFHTPAYAQDGTTTLTWSIEGVNDLSSLDPAKASNAQDFQVVGLLYAGLVRVDESLVPVPDLAESWTVSDDGLTYTFKLKSDIKFSDGSAITPDDFIFSLEHALDPSTGGWTGPFYLSNIVGADDVAAGKTTSLTGVKAVDAQTIEIKIKQPSAYFLSQLTFGSAKVISKAGAQTKDWDLNPIASGAFQIQAWNRGQNIILVPNKNYWQPASKISTLTMPFFQDSETAYQLYRTGGLDIMGSQQNPIPAVHVPEVKDSPDYKSGVSFATRYVGFNNVVAPFNNVDVRQAFALAIDKETLANSVLAGTVKATDRILPNGIPGSETPIKVLHFDAQAAKDALAKAGVTPESIGKITLTYGVEGDNERVVTVLQAMWKENLGVDVTLEPLELATFSAKLNEMIQTPETGLQAYYSIWGADYPDPQNFLSQQLRTGVGNNNGHYSNAKFDELVDQADVLVNDLNKRLELYGQAEELAVNEVGWLPLYNPSFNLLMKPYVQGMYVTGQGLVIADYGALAGKAP
ncbi:MAG: peptide ABC transporter substrate-binding protein [Anaerolineae bacterium]|nr:peptide ABC transporter substrate-binding protein [Anaerolineae bacterium]